MFFKYLLRPLAGARERLKCSHMRFQWTYLRLDKYGQFLWIVNLQRTLTTGLAKSGVRILIENLQKNSGRVCLVAGGDLRQVPAAVCRLLGHDQPEGRT